MEIVVQMEEVKWEVECYFSLLENRMRNRGADRGGRVEGSAVLF